MFATAWRAGEKWFSPAGGNKTAPRRPAVEEEREPPAARVRAHNPYEAQRYSGVAAALNGQQHSGRGLHSPTFQLNLSRV
jgi:hypothetical protein